MRGASLRASFGCLAVVALMLGVGPSRAGAQIVYESVKYQHGVQNKFYYGGNDPRVFASAGAPVGGAGRWGRVHGYDFISGNVDTHRAVSGEPERVYSDAIPGQNARIFGFTATDARNDAYAAVPTYFRKADLLRDAEQIGDGTWVVPVTAGAPGPRFYTSPDSRQVAPSASAPASLRKPLFIIPRQPEKPATSPDRKLAAAR